MSTFDHDDDFDAMLRDSMHGEAENVLPAGDGLSRIQQRVSARRARLRWMRPVLALGSAAVLAVVGVAAYAAVHGNGGNDRVDIVPPASQLPTQPPSFTPSPTPTTPPVAAAVFPKRAIFPFTSAKDERAWEQQAAAGHSPWQADPASVATFWVTNFLQLSSVNQVIKMTSTPTRVDVAMGRLQSDAGSSRQIAVTTVHLLKFGRAWIVTGATEDSGLLRISSPRPGTVVTSPLTASGPGGGVHRAAAVQVRDATTPTMYGEGHDGSFGSTQGWSAAVPFSAAAHPVGVLLVIESSDADGLPLRVAAEQVRFGSSSVSAGPQYFYGNRNGRIAKFLASNAASITYLTPPNAGSSDAQLIGDKVYYLTGNSTCGAHVSAVATTGGPPALVSTADNGYSIKSFAVSQDSTKIAVVEDACHVSTDPQAKLVFRDLTTHAQRSIDFTVGPPAVIGDPSWEPDGVHVDAIVATGTNQYLARYDSTSSTSMTPRNACPGWDNNNGKPWALETDASGTIWFATQTGSSMQVVKCTAGGNTAVVAFTVQGNRQPWDVDVSSDGSVLLTDSDGHIWRWNGSGDATALSPSQPVTQVTW